MGQTEDYGFPFASKYSGVSDTGFPQGDRDATDRDLAALLAAFFTDGIVVLTGMSADSLKVSGVAGSMNLRIESGVCVIAGHARRFVAPTMLTVPYSEAAQELRVILRMSTDDAERRIWLMLADGDLIRTDTMYDLQVASVSVPAGTSLINNATVTDTRGDYALCGFSAPRGSPAYQPPGDIPAVVWQYVYFRASLPPEQIAIVENNPSLMAIANMASPSPRGVINMWSGSIATIPAGWALCNGSNGTPDLRDRFVVGAGNTYTVAATGGAASVALTVAQLASHAHTVTGYTNYNYTPHVTGLLVYTAAQASTITTISPLSSTGSGAAHENRPPYYALAYIMKL